MAVHFPVNGKSTPIKRGGDKLVLWTRLLVVLGQSADRHVA